MAKATELLNAPPLRIAIFLSTMPYLHLSSNGAVTIAANLTGGGSAVSLQRSL
jgi:hypothetical protein